MNITPAGDHDWRSFNVPGPDAWDVRIETISDLPGSFTDDTDLALWMNCPEMAGTLIGFNDDKGGDFTSRINASALAPGTYYVEVGGFADTETPDDFTFELEVTGTGPPGVMPEPSTGLLVAIGLTCLAAGRRYFRPHATVCGSAAQRTLPVAARARTEPTPRV